MQIILHGNRIATNGSLRLLATPEQWDAIPIIKAHQPDKEHDRLTADLSYPAYHLDYHVDGCHMWHGVAHLDDARQAPPNTPHFDGYQIGPDTYSQRELDATPFGVPPTLREWGGAEQVAGFGTEMYFLYEAFPDIVSPEYTLRAANYLLGMHPVSSVWYIAAIGTASKLRTYNRGDDSYIPGARFLDTL